MTNLINPQRLRSYSRFPSLFLLPNSINEAHPAPAEPQRAAGAASFHSWSTNIKNQHSLTSSIKPGWGRGREQLHLLEPVDMSSFMSHRGHSKDLAPVTEEPCTKHRLCEANPLLFLVSRSGSRPKHSNNKPGECQTLSDSQRTRTLRIALRGQKSRKVDGVCWTQSVYDHHHHCQADISNRTLTEKWSKHILSTLCVNIKKNLQWLVQHHKKKRTCSACT